jgi:hypothetical protein
MEQLYPAPVKLDHPYIERIVLTSKDKNKPKNQYKKKTHQQQQKKNKKNNLLQFLIKNIFQRVGVG